MNLTEARETTSKIVKEAGAILKRHFELRDTTDKSKGGLDFVTEADEEVDRFLVDRLKIAFPNTNFLTEESASKEDAVDNYSKFAKFKDLWVIDPLDGTTLFSRGDPNFSISVGLVDKEVYKMGIIYLPITDRLFWAQQDREGAFLNDKRIYVSHVSELRETVVTTDWPHDLSKRITTVDWQRDLSPHVRSIRILGSAATALSLLACGETDVFIHPGIKPWDVAAGCLLVEKAGGKVTRLDGSEHNPFNPDVLASNGLLHNQISKLTKV